MVLPLKCVHNPNTSNSLQRLHLSRATVLSRLGPQLVCCPRGRQSTPELAQSQSQVLTRRARPCRAFRLCSLSSRLLPWLAILQPHWPPHCSLNLPGFVLLQGLCTSCSLCLKSSSSHPPGLAPSVLSGKSVYNLWPVCNLVYASQPPHGPMNDVSTDLLLHWNNCHLFCLPAQ